MWMALALNNPQRLNAFKTNKRNQTKLENVVLFTWFIMVWINLKKIFLLLEYLFFIL